MKKLLSLFILMHLPMLVSAQTASDVKNSGCLRETRGIEEEPSPTIVLTKEGNILTVELQNYESNCCTEDFNVTSSISGGSDGGPCSVSVSVAPASAWDCDCECPFNVSFTVRDLEPNSFYLNCWWYKGQVELKEGEPLVLEYKIESVVIDDISFNLLKIMHKAMLMRWATAEKEIRVPSEVIYEGETYSVTCFDKDAFWDLDYVTKITIPKTIRSTDLDVDGIIWANPFRESTSIEWIEVEEGCPLLSSVDGVLFAANKTMLLGYPIASQRETYIVPEGVTNIRSGTFVHNKYLRKLVIPEEVTYLGWHLFSDTKSLEELYIKGVLEPECMDDNLFGGMSTNVVVYVQPSEVDKYKAIYKGPVYPLPEQPIDNMAYRPLVKEGKHWTYDNFMPLRPAEYDHYYYYDLKGDTLIAGRQCLKMYSDTRSNDSAIRYEGALYEENKKVYCFFPGKEEAELLYDFDCVVGDTLNVYIGQLVVTDIQSEALGDITIKKYTLQPVVSAEEQMGEIFWIEGVGATKDFFGMLPLPGNYSTLKACELNGEMLYQNLTEEGNSMFVDGRNWRYEHLKPYWEDVTYLPTGYITSKYVLKVDGDTIFDGRPCKRLIWDTPEGATLYGYGYEEYGKVMLYAIINDPPFWAPFPIEQWVTLYDFTVSKGSECHMDAFFKDKIVREEGTVENDGTVRRYIGLGDVNIPTWPIVYAVEGIGSSFGLFEFTDLIDDASSSRFIGCYNEDTCLYSAEDFTKLGSGDTTPQMAYYYYKGTKIPLTLNESKVCVNIPKECKGTSERVQANAKVLTTINDDTFDIFVISRSDFEKLTSLDSWKEDSKSVILTSGYFTENNEEVFATPYLNIKLKKEEDKDLLTSYAEKYRLRIVSHSALMPLWYILSVTLESEKSPLECANELWETGYFAAAEPSFAADDYGIEEPYRPFVEEGKVWKVGTIPTILGNPVQIVDYYYFDGDTIIDGKSCKLMMCQRYVSPDYSNDYWTPKPSLNIVGAWYEEGKKVYFYNTEKGRDHWRLKYDFSLDADETVCLFDDYPPFIIGPRQTGGLKGFKGVYRDVMINQDIRSTIWLEGVGGLDAPFRNAYPDNVDRVPEFLMSCTVGDEVIYLNDEYEDGATPESMEAKKNRFDFTHTIKTKPHAPRRNGSGDAEESEMQPLYGEYNDLQLGIHLNSLDDTYLVRITNESGQVVYEKTVNAGNIVALSIDISAYAKGRYTVTLENSRESFTGEFEAQTTGIEAITNNKEVIRHNIYNLQGQRLNSLQKGLNIVNGQKIYVK